MSERLQRRRVVQWLKSWNAIPVENPAQPGTPDINYVEGWIELKQLKAWPRGEGTIVRVEHFTPQQRNWHKIREARGGVSWVLIQVGSHWLLIQGGVAADILGRVNRAELLRAAHHWGTAPTAEQLKEALRRHDNCKP